MIVIQKAQNPYSINLPENPQAKHKKLITFNKKNCKSRKTTKFNI
jgi:hypothetical protein